MSGLWGRVTITTKLYLLTAILAVGTIAILLICLHFFWTSALEQRHDQTRRLVTIAAEMLEDFVAEAQSGALTTEEAKKRAIAHIARIKYDNSGYFWINDTNGFMLSHPFAALNKTDATDLQDAKGFYVIRDVIKIAEKPGGGFYTYYWPPGPEAKLKVSYVTKIPEWDWVIGSGVAVEDIEEQFQHLGGHLGGAALAVIAIVTLLSHLIGQSVAKPIIALNRNMQRLALGDLRTEIDQTDRNDEVGAMARTVKIFLENARRVARMDEERAENERIKSEFVSVVSHELRTPLTSIRGSLGLIAGTMNDALPEKASHLVDIALQNCERLIGLINDILDIDKAASGKMAFQCAQEDLGHLLAMAVEMNRAFAEKYYVRLNYAPPAQGTLVSVDAQRFQQVLSNLISNAVKFSPGGGRVDLFTKTEGPDVTIIVKDYGLGIPEDFQSRIFDKFSQADSSTKRDKPGTGLGLHISKQLIEAMEGTIGFETQKGIGTSFWIRLPLSQNASGEKRP